MNHSSTTARSSTRRRRAATMGLALFAALVLGGSGAAFGVSTPDLSGGGAAPASSLTSTIDTTSCFTGQLADRWGADSGPAPRCVAGIGRVVVVAHRTGKLDPAPAIGSPCFMTPVEWNAGEDGPRPTC